MYAEEEVDTVVMQAHGWTDERYPDGTVIWTAPPGDKYITHPNNAPRPWPPNAAPTPNDPPTPPPWRYDEDFTYEETFTQEPFPPPF
ncbi:MAG: hypothetical protein QOE20_4940 [Mycobacterium sp.]|nr:hypothetical protein [Mycobacterium sp.]